MQKRYVFSDANGKEIDRMFYEKELQKRNQEEFRVEKKLKRNRDMPNEKAIIISFNSYINNKTCRIINTKK